jgi:hypothetical protein
MSPFNHASGNLSHLGLSPIATPRYRGCEVNAEAGVWPVATVGGPNSAYAATPMSKRIGITIGGTRYLKTFLADHNNA